jgi:SNF2 family DNA or RNA helicase
MEWDEPFWLVTNIETIRYNGIYQVHPETNKKMLVGVEWPFPEIPQFFWNVVVVDEFHMLGLNNTETLTSRTMYDTKALKKIDLSGTPMGGKPLKLYSVLHHLEPQEFSSKWGFVNMWLDVTPGERGVDIGDVKDGKEDAFSEMLGRYVVRRLKSEVLPWLPEKDPIDIWVKMEPKQAEQYEHFAELAEIMIEEEHLSAVGILAEYMRLKQFANAVQRLERKKVWDPNIQEHVDKIIPYPTEDSCKLPEMMRILGEHGIEKEDPSDEACLIYTSSPKLWIWCAIICADKALKRTNSRAIAKQMTVFAFKESFKIKNYRS